MKNQISNRFFVYAADIFYNYISPKFKTGSFKKFMDYAYAIFEKIAIHFISIYTIYIDIYKELVEKEVKILQINSDDSILVIGCGSIPATSILISQYSKPKKIVSIDYDKTAIKNAVYLVNNSDFDKNLHFEYADGLNYSLESFNEIFVLYGIKKQKEILHYIYQNMNDSARVIFRTTNDSLEQFLDGKKFLEQYFTIEKTIQSEELFDTVSLLLKKNTQ
ncbi:MAG: methyltransferase domain-containing protein [Thermoplasmatota archaeon]